MTRDIEIKSCHLWGILWFGIIGALMYPMVINTGNVLNHIPEGTNNCAGYVDFYNHSIFHCDYNNVLFGDAYFLFIGNLALIGITIFFGLYWINGYYRWVRVSIKSCW